MANKDFQNGFIIGLTSKAKFNQKTDAYKSITYNDDNTITLIDNDNTVHTMSYSYEDSKISQVLYDDEEFELSYNNDNITKVQSTDMNFGGITQSSGSVNKLIALETKAITVGVYDDPSPIRLTCVVQGSDNWYYRSFLDYDLSGIPQGSKILSARLFLYLPENADNLSNFKKGYTWIGKVTSQWDETIQWGTQPSFTNEYGKYSDCKRLRDDDVNTWINYDITGLVQELIDDPENNYGITIVNGNEGEYAVTWVFRNRRYSEKYGEDYSTYIEIYYE